MGSMRKSRLSHYKQAQLTEYFVSGTTARTAASLCGVNRKTAAFYFLRLREIIAYELETESEGMFAGDLRPKFPPAHAESLRLVHLPPTLDRLGLDFFGFDQFGGLVSPSDLMSMIGDLFPIALWGRSSL